MFLPSVETVPPSPAETVKVYCVGLGFRFWSLNNTWRRGSVLFFCRAAVKD
jgi:hypothetical protein